VSLINWIFELHISARLSIYFLDTIFIFLDLLFANRCAFIYGADGKLEKFTREQQDRLVRDVIEPMASDGLRTIAVAYRDFVPGKAEINQVHYDNEPNWDDEDNIINNLTCVLIVGIEDPVRPEVFGLNFPIIFFFFFFFYFFFFMVHPK